MRKSLLVAPAFVLLAGIAVVVFVASFGRSTSAAQNANSSQTTNKNENRSINQPSGAGQISIFAEAGIARRSNGEDAICVGYVLESPCV